MTFSKAIRYTTILAVSSTLAGCLGGGTAAPTVPGAGGAGGGGTPPPPAGSFASRLATAQGTTITQTPLTGTANYTGEVSLLTQQNQADALESIVGDLDLSIDFGNVVRPVSGTATNFAGPVNGQQAALTGTLSTANAPTGINDVTGTNIPLPPPAAGSITQTSLSVEMQGNLTDPTNQLTGGVLMTLQGQFYGPNGAVAHGASGAIIAPPTGPNMITGGEFYVNRQ